MQRYHLTSCVMISYHLILHGCSLLSWSGVVARLLPSTCAAAGPLRRIISARRGARQPGREGIVFERAGGRDRHIPKVHFSALFHRSEAPWDGRLCSRWNNRLIGFRRTCSMLLEEAVLAIDGRQEEMPPKARILDIHPPGSLAATALILGDVDPVLGDQLSVDVLR